MNNYFNNTTKEDTKEKVIELYKYYDELNPEGWGWCSLNKAGCFIDYVDNLSNIKNRPITCVEIGVYQGKSLLPVALELKRQQNGIIIGIEPWSNEEATKGYTEDNFIYWDSVDMQLLKRRFFDMVYFLNLDYYIEIRQESSNETREIQDIDFLYIDGQHTKQVLKDIDKFASCVTKNGYCIVDDITWNTPGMDKIPNKMEELGFTLIHQVDDSFVYLNI